MANKFDDIRPKDYRKRIAKFRREGPVDLIAGQYPLQAKGTSRKPLATGLEEYTGAWTEVEVSHLLKRTLFGVKRSEVASFVTMTLSDAVETLLTAEPKPSPPVNDYNPYLEAPDPDVPAGEVWVEAAVNDDTEGGRITSLKGWLIKNMKEQSASLHEKMIVFWHNLLAIQSWEVFVGKADYQYFDMLRTHAFGNYKTFVRDLTLDPAMLLFLNGTFNRKEVPDENYARELQELFTVGKGPGSQYTEGDVRAAARVLTGWVINFEEAEAVGPASSFFHPPFHDTEDKQFSAFYGNKTITGKSGLAGAEELDELLTLIFDTQEAAKYICRRLYNFFVYPVIDEATETNVIEPLADQFRNGGYEILPVLRTLFKSAHFFDVANRGAMIKSPLDFLIGTMRALNLSNPFASHRELDSAYHINALWVMAGQGQELGDPPSVSGWPAYYQAPQYDKSWITTDTLTKRAQQTDGLTFWGFWINEDHHAPTDLTEYLSTLVNPADPNELLRETALLLFGITLDNDSFNELKLILLSGQSSDYYWTDAYNAFVSSPTEENKAVVENRLKPAIQAMLQLGEFQLM